MRSSRIAQTLAGLALCAGSVAMLAWAGAVAEVSATDVPVGPTVAGEPFGAAGIVKASTPADESVAGTAAEILNRVGVSELIQVGTSSSRVCGQSPGGWHAADSARGVNGRISVSVEVTAWRAGTAVVAYKSARDAVSGCAAVSERSGQDEFTGNLADTYSTNSGGGRGAGRFVGVIRLGDTLTVIQVASIGSDGREAAEQTLGQARRVLTERLRGRCRSVNSHREPGQVGRDPYGGNYTGRVIESKLMLGMLAIRSKDEESQVNADRGDPTWRPPAARPVPDLAPLDLEKIARAGIEGVPAAPDLLIDAFGRPLPRGDAPELIDASALIPPTDPRPDREPGPAPRQPGRPEGLSVTQVQVPDPEGPGCGWEFTGVRPPIIDVTKLTVEGRQAQIDRLAQDAGKQADRLVEDVAWPRQYAEWVVRQRAAANWKEYERVKAEARRERERAERIFESTVERWRTGNLPKVPTPRPTSTNGHRDPTPVAPTPSAGPPEES